MRSGEPDFIDKMVAITFANMAVDCILEGKSGLMTGIVDGCYALAPIPDPKLGPAEDRRRDDVQRRPVSAELREQARIADLFLTRAS